MTSEDIDTVIIGAGQAALAISYYLSQLGREHVILERQRVGERWRSERWDSRVPRRFRGRDFAWWEFALGEFDRTADQRPPERMAPLLTGVGGGHDIDLRHLAAEGVVLLGHLLSGLDIASSRSRPILVRP